MDALPIETCQLVGGIVSIGIDTVRKQVAVAVPSVLHTTYVGQAVERIIDIVDRQRAGSGSGGRDLLADGTLALGLLRQSQRLHRIGIVSVLRNHLFLDAQHGVVKAPFGGDGGIARRGQRIGGVDFGLLGALHGREGCAEFLRFISRIGGLIITQILDGGQGILIGLQLDGTQTPGLIFSHFLHMTVKSHTENGLCRTVGGEKSAGEWIVL